MCDKIRPFLKDANERSLYWRACHISGHCPTSKEIRNDKVEQLAKRLIGLSPKETLTNILEWQDRNIVFWNERHPMTTTFYLIAPVSCIIALLLTILILIANFQLLPFFVNVFFGVWLKIILSSAITVLVIMALIIRSNRKIPLKEGLWNAVVSSISLHMLLDPERRIGVCRDYAKLTACLLSNTNPNAGIYFVHSAGHVATGIRIENTVYVLDQHLPVLTMNQWCTREYGSADLTKIPFEYRTSYKLKEKRLGSVPTMSLLSEINTAKLTEEELIEKMKNLLDISKEHTNDTEVLPLKLRKWKKGAMLFAMNDEIVNYSLARALKNKILNELIELNQITNIEINNDKDEKEKDDLIFRVTFR